MHTILVADDSVTILKAVEIVFDKEPFQVVKAGSGAEAIARARELKPHLVLTDHTMGDKSGYEVAEALRADPSTAGIPVMILSGTSVPYDEGRARAAGVVGHLPKPFDCQTLLDRVRNLLGVAATAPGTALGVPASQAPMSAAVAAMPRPPGVGAAGMPRPPGLGLPRPPVTGSSPAPSLAPAVAVPIARSPTPQPARAEIDPFGFGASLGGSSSAASASAPAPISTTPRPATSSSGGSGAFSNPFATATSIGAAPASAPTPLTSTPMASTPMTSPASISAQSPAVSGGEPWRTGRTSDVFDKDESKAPKATSSAVSSSPPSSAAPRTTAPSYVSESEFLEVADIEVTDIPATPSLPPQDASVPDQSARETDKLDIARLAKLEAESRAPERPVVTLEPVSAAQAVAEKAATVIAKSGGVVPSKEALTEEARQIVERVAWEVVPELAEVIIREEIQRLLKSRT